MKKTITLLLAAIVSLCLFPVQSQLTRQEAMTLVEQGKAIKRNVPSKKIFGSDSRFERMPSERDFKVKTMTLNTEANPGMNNKLPMRVTAGGSSIYGITGSSEDEMVAPIGLYELASEGMECEWVDNFYYSEYYNLRNGFLLDEKIIGQAIYSFMGYIFGYSRLAYDFESGELLTREDYDYESEDCLIYDFLTYNTLDGYVYGIAISNDKEWGLYRTTTLDFSKGEKIGPTTGDLTSFCYNQDENAFFGITDYGYFTRIDLDGSVTDLFPIEDENIDFDYMTALVYSPAEKLYYANVHNYTYSYIITLDPATKSIKSKNTVPYGLHFKFLFCTDEYDDDLKKPQAPTIDKVSFEDGSTTGYIEYRMPSESLEGSKLEGEIKCYPTVNGQPLQTAQEYVSSPGSILRVDYVDLEEGKTNFKLYVECGGLKSRTLTSTFFVGNDTPLGPSNVRMSKDEVKWSKVRKSENDGFLALSECTYKVYINDEFIEETSKTSVKISLPTDQEYTLYTAKVVCVCRGKESAPSLSNGVVSGKPYNLPIFLAPTKEQSALCPVINGNSDGHYWNYNSYYKAFQVGCGARGNDDWLIIPAFNADGTDKYYSLTFETSRFAPNYLDEMLSVYVGSEPTVEGMTVEVIPAFKIAAGSPNYDKIKVLFKAPAVGPCYVGFYSSTPPEQYGTLVKNVEIVDNNVTDESPQQVLNLDARPFEKGELKATVSFNLPRKTIGGESISKEVEVTAYVKGENTVTVSGRPGARVTAVIDTKQGDNVISVMPCIGDLGSLESEVEVYTGVVAPLTPEIKGIASSPDMQSVTISWDPVTGGINGGYVVPEEISYDIYLQKTGIWGETLWEVIENVGAATSYTYTCEPGTPLKMIVLGVGSINPGGFNGTISAGMGMIGTPYSLPMHDNFTEGTLNLSPWLTLNPFNDYTLEFGFKEVADIGSFDIDAEYLLMAEGKTGDKGRLAVPRFSSMGIKDAKLSLKLYTGKDCAPTTLYVGYQGATKLIELGKITADPDGPDFSVVDFDIPEEAMGRYWVQIYIDTEYVKPTSLCLLEAIDVTTSTSVESPDTLSGSIVGGNGTITLTGYCGKDVTVTSMSGMTVIKTTAASDFEVYNVESGFYIVTAGEAKTKIIVR